MKLYTDLDIVNGLSTCRDMFEAKAYLKANNIDISDQELEILQSQCSKINSERTLTIRQLNNVAGGGKSWHGGSPKTKNLDAGRPRSSSCGDISDMPQEFTPEHDQLTHQMKEAVRTFAALRKEAEQAKIQAERTAEEEHRKNVAYRRAFPGMQEFYKEFFMTEMIQQYSEETCQQQMQIKDLIQQLAEVRRQLDKTKQMEQAWRWVAMRNSRQGSTSHTEEVQGQVPLSLGQKTSRHYAPTPVPSSVPDPEPAPKLNPTYSIDPKPIEKSSSFGSRSTPVVKVTASAPTKDGAFSRVFGSPITSSEGSPRSSEAETDSDTSSGSSSPTNSTFAAFNKDASLQGHVPFF